MELNEVTITKAIIERFSQKLLEYTEVDVAVVGAARPDSSLPTSLPGQERRSRSSSGSFPSAGVCGAGG